MDAVYFFLKERTKFIRYYYDEGVKPFLAIKHQIGEKLPPFDSPTYSEDAELPYLEEWMAADTAIGIAGLACISLLADSAKLYFYTLQKHVIGFAFDNEKEAFKNGFPPAYKAVLGEILDTDWSDCPASFDMIEQIVLARNRGQHGDHLTSIRTRHDARTLRRHPDPFFASEQERRTWIESGGNPDGFLTPEIEISRDKLYAALECVEVLADWIEGRMDKAREWRMRKQQ